MDCKFDGKVAIVTGAGAGVGKATALELARRGAKVVVNDLGTTVEGEGSSTGPAEQTVREICDAGGEAIASTDSVAGWDSAHRIVENAMDSFGRLDVVVNNAGNLRWKHIWETTEDDFRSTIDVHMGGVFYVSRAAVPHFMAQKSGAFVHLTSTSGVIGHIKQFAYCGAKAGIAGLSKALALELREYGVRSNCVAPFAAGRMSQGASTQADPKLMAVLEKLTPEQNARLITALASDAASDVSGQIFICRGNEIMLSRPGLPVRSVVDGKGWAPEGIVERAFVTLRPDFAPLKTTNELITWPVV